MRLAGDRAQGDDRCEGLRECKKRPDLRIDRRLLLKRLLLEAWLHGHAKMLLDGRRRLWLHVAEIQNATAAADGRNHPANKVPHRKIPPVAPSQGQNAKDREIGPKSDQESGCYDQGGRMVSMAAVIHPRISVLLQEVPLREAAAPDEHPSEQASPMALRHRD